MNTNSFRSPAALALPAACALCALVVVAARLSSTRGPSDAPPFDGVTAPAPPAGPAHEALAAEPPRTETSPSSADVVRPEVALLEELPSAHLTRADDCALADLRVSFKLEPRLTRSLYMGDRWTSPAEYLQVGAGSACTVEAGIRGLDAHGKAVTTPATWHAADPDMVQISEPGPGNTVKLTVVRPGRTTVEIASEGIVKELPLHAVSYGDTLMVALNQE